MQQYLFWLLPRHIDHFDYDLLSCFISSEKHQSSNLVGTLRLIDSIGLRVERPYSPSSRRIPWYFSRSLAHTHAVIDPTMPNMCSGAFYVLQRLNNSCAIYAIYTVVKYITKMYGTDIVLLYLPNKLNLETKLAINLKMSLKWCGVENHWLIWYLQGTLKRILG